MVHFGGKRVPEYARCYIIRAPAMAKHMLRYFNTGYPVQMGCGGMTEQSAVELFIDADLIGGGAEDILQGPRGDAFFAFGYEKGSAFSSQHL